MIAHLYSMLLGAALLHTGVSAFLLHREAPGAFVFVAVIAVFHLIVDAITKGDTK